MKQNYNLKKKQLIKNINKIKIEFKKGDLCVLVLVRLQPLLV